MGDTGIWEGGSIVKVIAVPAMQFESLELL